MYKNFVKKLTIQTLIFGWEVVYNIHNGQIGEWALWIGKCTKNW